MNLKKLFKKRGFLIEKLAIFSIVSFVIAPLLIKTVAAGQKKVYEINFIHEIYFSALIIILFIMLARQQIMKTKENKILKAALWYAKEKKWLILPLYGIKNGKCECSNPKCDSPGKHPRIKTAQLAGASPFDWLFFRCYHQLFPIEKLSYTHDSSAPMARSGAGYD